MSDKPTFSQIRTALQAALDQLEEANGRYADADQRERLALRDKTQATNDINNLHKEAIKIEKDLAEILPWGSDWRRSDATLRAAGVDDE